MNKTCGECKHLNRELAFCRACGVKWLKDTDGANCKYFEKITKPTNGDKIRQMSDEELATAWSNGAFVFAWCADCLRYCREYESEETKYKCKQQMLSWLKQEAKDE